MLDSRSLFLVSNWKFRGPRRVDIRDVVDVLDVLEVLDVWDVGDVLDPVIRRGRRAGRSPNS